MKLSRISNHRALSGRWLLAGCLTLLAACSGSSAVAQIYVLNSEFIPTDVSGDGSVVVGINTFDEEYFDWVAPIGGSGGGDARNRGHHPGQWPGGGNHESRTTARGAAAWR